MTRKERRVRLRKTRNVKLVVLLLILCAAALLSKPAEAHLVCDDNLRFCQAGCVGPNDTQSCRDGCLSDYTACEQSFEQN